jgi:hypothetical protein
MEGYSWIQRLSSKQFAEEYEVLIRQPIQNDMVLGFGRIEY